LLSLLLCTFGNLVSGLVLSSFSYIFTVLPALIILIPPSTDLRGNVYGSLGSKLGTYLHIGKIEPKFKIDPKITENMLLSLFLLLAISIFIGFIVAKISTSDLMLNTNIILIAAIAAMLSSIFMMPATLAIAIGSYKRGWDPDNITAPIMTLVGDMVTLPIIFLSTTLVLAMALPLKLILIMIFIIILIILFNKINKKDVKESLPILILCALISLGAGLILSHKIEELITIPGILTIIPAFLVDGGAMSSIMAARLSSMLHLGILQPELVPPKEILNGFLAMHLIGFVIFTLVGIVGQLANHLLSIPTIPTSYMLASTIIAGQIVIVISNLLTYYISIISFKKGINPDNITIPILTSLMDVIGSFSLILALKIFSVV